MQVRRKFIEDSQEEIYETDLAQLFSEEDEVILIRANCKNGPLVVQNISNFGLCFTPSTH